MMTHSILKLIKVALLISIFSATLHAGELTATQVSVNFLEASVSENISKIATISNIQRDKKIAKIDLSYSGGTMTFIDETPDRELPSISIMVVENSKFNTLANFLKDKSTTPLEVYVALAPRGAPIPPRMQLDHNYRRHGIPVRIYSFENDPLQNNSLLTENDNWSNGCTNHNDWKDGFSSWAVSQGWEGGLMTPGPGIAHASFNFHDDAIEFETWNGYITGYSNIWLGVCNQLNADIYPAENLGDTSFRLVVQLWYLPPESMPGIPEGSILIDNASVELSNAGERYLYHNFSHPYSGKSYRLSLSDTGNYNPNGTPVFVSAAGDNKNEVNDYQW